MRLVSWAIEYRRDGRRDVLLYVLCEVPEPGFPPEYPSCKHVEEPGTYIDNPGYSCLNRNLTGT